MQIIKINQERISNAEIGLIADFLQQGKVVVYPTDTIYGLGCLANNKKAIKKIFQIKKRDAGKPLIILVNSLAMARKYCIINNKQTKLLKSIWPGPVTVIMPHKGILPKEISAGMPNLAVRLPKNDFLHKIIKRVKTPIVSTSLNISEHPYFNDLDSISKHLKGLKPDLVIDAGKLPKAKPSTIIDITDQDRIIFIRK